MLRLLLSLCVSAAAFVFAAPQPEAFSRPLVFEPNRGQAPANMQWLARGAGFQLGFTSEGATLALLERLEEEPSSTLLPEPFELPQAARTTASPQVSTVKLRLFGSRAWQTTGLEPTGGASNYFLSDQPENWLTDVHHYARVTATGVYEGVDVVFYGREGILEYDFIVAPGADPQQIQLEFDGAANIRLDKDSGDLVLTTSSGREVRNGQPKVYQQIGDRMVDVKSSYQLLSNGRAAFTLADYDRQHPLVIDPTVTFTTFLRGSNADAGHSIAVDTAGNAYVTGETYSNNFPILAGFQGDAGDIDAFVTKLSPTGAILFSTYLGGSKVDFGMGIAVDSSGVYVSGHTRSSNFPKKQPMQPFRNDDAFVTKLSLLGNAIVYSTFLGGTQSEYGYGITVDSSQSAYVAGQTYSKDFPVVGGFQHYPNDPLFVPINGFVAKLSPAGTSLVYSTYLGGTNLDYVSSIAIDASLAAHVTGETCSPDFPFAGFNSLPYPGTCTGFVTKLSPQGNAVGYSTFLVNNIKDSTGIALDAAGNAYVTGISTYPTPPTLTQHVFVAKLTVWGSLYYFRYLRGNDGSAWAESIATDANGNAYVVGATTSTSFPGAPPITPNPYAGFLVRYDPNGNGPFNTVFLGAQINDVAVFRRPPPNYPSIYTTGYRYTGGTAFPNRDAFVVKLDGP
jgi:hypothetical protein